MRICKGIGVLIFIVFSTAVQAKQFDIEKLAKVKWSQAESEHFIVMTDVKPSDAEVYAQELEEFRYFITVFLQQSIVEGLVKPKFLLVKNKGTFKKLGLPKLWAGVFIPTLYGPYSIANAGKVRSNKMDDSFGSLTVRHELVHYLVDNSLAKFKPPLWYSEGLADYLATYKDKNEKVLIGSIEFVERRLASLRKQNFLEYEDIDLEQLFKAKRVTYATREVDRKRDSYRFYARALAVVHYFLSDDKLTIELSQYLNLIDRGEDVDSAFSKAFKRSFETVDKEVLEYINGRKLYGKSFAKSAIKLPEFKVSSKPLNKEQDLVNLLEVMARTDFLHDQQEQYAEFNAAIDKYAKNSLRAQILKIDYFDKLTVDQKISRAQALLKTNPSDPDVLSLNGRLLTIKAEMNFLTGEFDDDLNRDGRKLLRKSLKLNPLSGVAYNALAKSYYIEPYSNKNMSEAALGFESAMFFLGDAKLYRKKADMLLASGRPDLAYPVYKRYFQRSDSNWENGYGAFLLRVTELATIKSWSVDELKENKIVFKNGAIYQGELKDDWPSGKGLLTTEAGMSYQGDWRGGLPNGEGKLTQQSTETRKQIDFVGIFDNANVSGKGKLIIGSKKRPYYSYQGNFKNGYENGQGSAVLSNGNRYSGGWFKGFFHGKGTLTLPNGKRFGSNWRMNHLQIAENDGDFFYGQFDNSSGEIDKHGICRGASDVVRYCQRSDLSAN